MEDEIYEKLRNKFREKYGLIVALTLNRDELKDWCKGDPILEKFEREINALNDDEEFIKKVEEEERMQAIEIAKEMLEENKSIQEIAEITELTPEEIEELK